MTRTVTTRRSLHAVAASAAAAIDEGTLRIIGVGFTGNGTSTPLCVRPAFGA